MCDSDTGDKGWFTYRLFQCSRHERICETQIRWETDRLMRGRPLWMVIRGVGEKVPSYCMGEYDSDKM